MEISYRVAKKQQTQKEYKRYVTYARVQHEGIVRSRLSTCHRIRLDNTQPGITRKEQETTLVIARLVPVPITLYISGSDSKMIKTHHNGSNFIISAYIFVQHIPHHTDVIQFFVCASIMYPHIPHTSPLNHARQTCKLHNGIKRFCQGFASNLHTKTLDIECMCA